MANLRLPLRTGPNRRPDAMQNKRRGGRASTKTSLEDEIAHLRGLDLGGLRARWQSVFQRSAPAHLTRHLLFAVTAYRLQADRFGDLDRETKQVLDRTDTRETGPAMFIRARKIDVIVVYKVDRLTRSLADFAKLVELIDAHNVSFVSVTQQFNTTTSMGRLTLNVLLSFAQFEREVTSERIRDKISASKRKGLWVGGTLPLGYEMKDGKIAIVEEEAELVRSIFRRYLELGSVNELLRDLKERNVRTKTRLLSTGAMRGGIPFGRGALYYLLSNRFYIGEVKYKNEILPGEQPAIMDRALFEAVRQKCLAQWSHRTVVRNKSDHLLTGLLFDDAGHRMIPTHATKAGVRYRYYVSTPFLHGEAKTASAGSVSRVPAADIEDTVVKCLNERHAAKQD